MTDRLPWKKGDRPRHFVATTPAGKVELWWHPTDTSGPAGWRVLLVAGDTRESRDASDKQAAADLANRMWPDIVGRERARVAKLTAIAELDAQIEAALEAGGVDVMAFGLGSSSRDRLVHILELLKQRGWLDGPLKPLREAVSNELYERRVRGR